MSDTKPMMTAHDLAKRAYERTGGATPDLKRVYEAYRKNAALASPSAPIEPKQEI